MQIGEFAKACNTKITILRHYDKEGLLTPDYIDRFTGYRYYSKEQIPVFKRITALKQAGFSLSEIRGILNNGTNNEDILKMFEKKKDELYELLNHLEEAKNMLLGDDRIMNVTFFENNQGIKAKCQLLNNKNKAIETIENTLSTYGYQRISSYHVEEKEISCDVVKLHDHEIIIQENVHIPFENDESIIGRWQTIGEFAVKEDFSKDIKDYQTSYLKEDIYFLPNGERYWSYSWTKGKLMIDDDVNTYVNDYTCETLENEHYMFIDLKSYNYRHGGRPTVLVLKQIDNRSYKAEDLVKKDKIDLPFVNDQQIIGTWKAIDYCLYKEAFDPNHLKNRPLYFSNIQFKENGEVIACYDYGKEKIVSRNQHEWTKGYWLRKWNYCACAYEIQIINDIEYLFIEWKSGNYRWGGLETDYYVFIRT